MLTLAAALSACRSASDALGGTTPSEGSSRKQVEHMNAVLLDDGLLVFDGHEAATVQCAALATSPCHAQALAAWAADGGVASERRALAMLHQACLRGFDPSCAQIHGPRALDQGAPDYPLGAGQMPPPGEARMLCTVSATGGVPSHCRLLQSVPGLDAVLLKFLSTTHVSPVTFFGRPVQTEYVFTLRIEVSTTISR